MDKSKLLISDDFRGRNIFLTGGTGFVGKVLIEKLLRSCPDIGNIYVLVRPKKGKQLHERLEFMLQDQLFDKLKEKYPEKVKTKLIPLAGDCMELGLGLSDDDRELIKREVSIIYHIAASVRFDDALKKAIILNTRGTREIAQLALETKQLALLVQISTTYCNCIVGGEIDERLYPAPTDWRKAIEIAERFDSGHLEQLTSKFLGPYPNTYTFTKALGEHVINDMCSGKIPVLIFRPSIVVSTWKDPVEGWIDNFNGPAGLLVACGKGLLRMSYQNPDIVSDYIPVDVTVKALIVVTYDMMQKKKQKEVEVFHCSNGYCAWMTLGETIRIGRDMSPEFPFNDALWVPKGFVTQCKLWAYINTIFFHLIPAFFLDLILLAKGQKPMLARLQMKIYNAALQLRYFTFDEWTFHNNKIIALLERIPKKDKEIWDYDFRSADVNQYMIKSMYGARKYLLKESDESLPSAKIHYVRMWWLDKAVMVLSYVFLFWFVLYMGWIEKFIEASSTWFSNLFTLDEDL